MLDEDQIDYFRDAFGEDAVPPPPDDTPPPAEIPPKPLAPNQ
jgi:hypothetical protein